MNPNGYQHLLRDIPRLSAAAIVGNGVCATTLDGNVCFYLLAGITDEQRQHLADALVDGGVACDYGER